MVIALDKFLSVALMTGDKDFYKDSGPRVKSSRPAVFYICCKFFNMPASAVSDIAALCGFDSSS